MKPGPPSLIGAKKKSALLVFSQPVLIAKAAWAAVRVPVNESGAITMRTSRTLVEHDTIGIWHQLGLNLHQHLCCIF